MDGVCGMTPFSHSFASSTPTSLSYIFPCLLSPIIYPSQCNTLILLLFFHYSLVVYFNKDEDDVLCGCGVGSSKPEIVESHLACLTKCLRVVLFTTLMHPSLTSISLVLA